MMIMGGALLLAVVVALMVSMKLAPRKEVGAVVTGTDVLVASKDLLAGETLKEDNVRWENYPDKVVYTGMIKRSDQSDGKKPDAYGKPLKRDVASGEPVTTQAIVDTEGSGNYLAASLGPGMRAIAISVRAETTAGGFVAPGDYVDIILNFQVNLRGDAERFAEDTVQRFASETILSNVHVLAVDQTAKDDKHTAKVGRTVTLEVDKHGAQVLTMAGAMGELTLALRRLGEKDAPEDAPVNITTDVSTSKVIQKIYRDESEGSTKTTSGNVRVYSGGNVSNMPVRETPRAAEN